MQKMLKELPHILVVDDDHRIASLVCRYLEDHGFIAVRAQSAAEARVFLKSMKFDALILDVMMPGESGVEFSHILQKDKDAPPVLMLSALGEFEDRIKGFEAGIDDYLAKPFEPQELLMRLNVILKRTRSKDSVERFRIGRWIYDQNMQSLSEGDKEVHLTTMEANLLMALAKKSGEVVSREELGRVCELDAGERTIDVQVTRLRRKLEEDTKKPRYLQTVRGKGYLLRCERL